MQTPKHTYTFVENDVRVWQVLLISITVTLVRNFVLTESGVSTGNVSANRLQDIRVGVCDWLESGLGAGCPAAPLRSSSITWNQLANVNPTMLSSLHSRGTLIVFRISYVSRRRDATVYSNNVHSFIECTE